MIEKKQKDIVRNFARECIISYGFWWLLLGSASLLYWINHHQLPLSNKALNLNSSLWIYYAGCGYIIGKIPMVIFEYNRDIIYKRVGWTILILTAPAWFILLTLQENWIFLMVEIAGWLLMMLGWNFNLKQLSTSQENTIAIKILKSCGIFILFLIAWYLIQERLFDKTTLLELINAISFILGTWALTRNYGWGWICYIILHLSTAQLMKHESESFLMWCQWLSIPLAVIGILGHKFVNNEK